MEKRRREDNGWSVAGTALRKRVVAFPLCSMRSQLWQMQDRPGAAVLLAALQLQTLALPALWGWAEGHVVES